MKNNSVIFFLPTQHTCSFSLVKCGYNIQRDQNRLWSQNSNPKNLMHDKMLSGSLWGLLNQWQKVCKKAWENKAMAVCPSETRESSILFFYKQNLPVESLSKQVEDYSNVSDFESAAHTYISLLEKTRKSNFWSYGCACILVEEVIYKTRHWGMRQKSDGLVGRWLWLLTGKHIKQLVLHGLLDDNNNQNLHFRNTHFRNPHLTSKRRNVTGLFFFFFNYQHVVLSEL